MNGQGDFEEIDFLFGRIWVMVKSYMPSANPEDDRETKKKKLLHTYTVRKVLQMLNIYVILGQARQYGPDPSASRVFLRNLTIEVILPLNLAPTPAHALDTGRHNL